MPLLLTALRWFGLKAGAFALLALCALAWGGWSKWQSSRTADALALSEARVAVLEAQRDAANALAADYQARAERARAAEAQARDAARKADAARARKWAQVRKAEREWAEVPVPRAVVEALR